MGLSGIKTVIVFFALVLFSAKTIAQNPLRVESSDLYQHTTNSSNVVGPVAGELTDTVTTGSSMRYYIIPSPLNTLYTLTAGGVLSGSLASTFIWSLSGITGTANGSIDSVKTPTNYENFTNYKVVTWTGIGTINLNVREQSAAGCLSSNTTTTPVAIIAIPSVQFSSTSDNICFSGSDGSLGYNLTGLPVNWTSSVSGLRYLTVDYTISCSNAGFGGMQSFSNDTVIETGAGSGTFDISSLQLDYYGVYTITITNVHDRISSKCNINGSLVVPLVYSFSLNPLPVSGPFYHRPNQ
jgi:hypothetical protein